MIEDGVSNVAYFRLDGGSSKLYTQEYVDKKDKERERLNKKLKQEKEKNKKAFKIIDEAMTEQMITGEATINLIELYAILKGK